MTEIIPTYGAARNCGKTAALADTGFLRPEPCVVCGQPVLIGPRSLRGELVVVLTPHGAMHPTCNAEDAVPCHPLLPSQTAPRP